MQFTIYRITNTGTGRTYVGMTSRPLQARIRQHQQELAGNRYGNEQLQRDYNAGHTELLVEVLDTATTLAAAKAAETKAIQAETNPYNIRCGRPHDMLGYHRRWRPMIRQYVYAEVLAFPSERADLQRRLGLKPPIVSMIVHGHRTAPAPNTSFATTRTDGDTVVQAADPPSSRLRKLYAGSAS